MADEVIPLHRWTHTGDKVLILKCVDENNHGYQGFDYPRQPDGGPHGLGPVTPATWAREPDCDSGGIFGWAWGLAFGDGKEPDYTGIWKVIAAHPEDVIDVVDRGVNGGKVKAVPNPEAGRCPEVIYSGTLAKAIQLILEGQTAWIRQAARGSAASSGYSSSAASSGYRSIAAITGEESRVSAGPKGIAASTADDCWWLVHEDAVFVQRWQGGHRCVTAADIGAQTGDRIRFVKGEIKEHIRKEAP